MYVAVKARRRSALTNYRRRIALLKSRLDRVVVRKSNSAVYAQIVEFTPGGDRVISCACSRELRRYGWSPRCNIPTAYLTGALLASKSSGRKLWKGLVLDTGLYRPVRNSVIFAAARGAVDAGLPILSSIEFDEARLRGAHIAAYASALRQSGERFKRQFGSYLDAGADPAGIEAAFEAAKGRIRSATTS